MKIEFIASGSGGGGSSITLTTTGTSGASTLVGSTLNVPIYSGATDQNLGNTNLVADANRSYTLFTGGSLDIENSSSNSVIKISSTNLEIGNTNKYIMPNARGSANDILGQTNGTGTCAWRTPSVSITYPAQSPASCGSETGVFGVSTLQIAQHRGDFADLGSTLAPITATMNTIALLQPPFRNIGTTNIQIASGVSFTDKIVIKFCSSLTGQFNFYVVKVSMPTLANPSALVVLPQLLGSWIPSIEEVGLVKCLEYNLPELEGETCAGYYVGWCVVGGFKEPSLVSMIAQYSNPTNATLTYI